MGKFSNTKMERSLATDLLKLVSARLESAGLRYVPCGSYRRGKAIVGDLDFVVLDYPSSRTIRLFSDMTAKIGRAGEKVASIVLNFQSQLCQVEFSNCPPASLGAYMLHSTGSGMFNMALRSIAKKRDFFLNQYGLYKIQPDHSKHLTRADTEEKILNRLGFKFIPPESRMADTFNQAYDLLFSNQL